MHSFRHRSLNSFLFGLIFSFLFISGWSDEKLPIYLTWQRDPTSTITIQWLSSHEKTLSEVEYKKVVQESSQNEWKTASGSCQKLPMDVAYSIHCTEINSLEPNSLYQFKIKGENTEYRFRTMPTTLSAEAPVRFIAGGDAFPDDIQPFEEMAKQAAKLDPRFVVLGGDLAYSVSEKRHRTENFDRWLRFLTSWSATMKDSQGCLIPLIVAIGNHEVLGYYDQTPEQAKFFYSLFAMPGPQGYNVLRCGSYLSLILLDSGHTHPIGGAQKEWLKTELSKQYATTHRFAIYHVPAFPSVRYFRQRESSAIRRHWVPLFEKYGVHAVFENHDHAYKRTYPLIDEHKDPSGVVYFGDGSWGVVPRIPKKAERTSYLAKTQSVRQCLEVTLEPKKRSFRAISSTGEVIDQYEQAVR